MKNSAIGTLQSAYPGDFGWLWVDDEWCMSHVTDDYVAIHRAPHLVEYRDLTEVVLEMPWYSVSLPPCEPGDPCTHHVIIRDRELSVTVSLTLPDEETSDRFFREIGTAAREFGE